MKIAFQTLGCKVNQYETEAMRVLFADFGYTVVKEPENPDVFVLNSCTVTAESDKKTRQTLRRFKRANPNCITVLCGCMAQAFPNEAAKLMQADIIFGNTDHSKIPELVEKFKQTGERIVFVEPHETGEQYKTTGISRFCERTRAYMKIEDGCDRFCTYCAIPYARGRVRSRELSHITDEAERLAANGYKEVVLVGINLSAFGKGTDRNICDAVEAVCKVQGIKRVRLGSLEPDHITDEMLTRLARQPKFCPQFHLSLQSGADATLKRMNRHYDTAFYFDLISRIRKAFVNPSITTDIMVGFVGETQEEFSQSVEFLKKCNFAKCHVFTYSKREGTNAAKLSGHLPANIKQQRSEIMLKAAADTQSAFLQSRLNSTACVLFETQKDGYIEGYTPDYLRVRVNTSQNLNGEIREVLLTKLADNGEEYIIGKLVE